MSAPGFYDSTVVFNGSTASTSYAYSTIVPYSLKNKMCVFVDAIFDVGATSAQFKFQQCLTNSASGEWYDLPIVNVSTITTSTDVPPEYYLTSKSFTQSIDSNTAAHQRLGPYEITVGMPFFRVAYKLTGGGAVTFKFTVTRVLL